MEKFTWINCLKSNKITLLNVVSIVIGIAVGFGVKNNDSQMTQMIRWVCLPGECYINCMNCLVVPLVIPSLVTALGTIESDLSKKIMTITALLFLGTNLTATCIGFIASHLTAAIGAWDAHDFNCSKRSDKMLNDLNSTEVKIGEAIVGIFINLLPPNLVRSFIQTAKPSLTDPGYLIDGIPEYMDSPSMLTVVFYSICFGLAASSIRNKPNVEQMLELFKNFNDVMMTLNNLVVFAGPFAIWSLVAGSIIKEQQKCQLTLKDVGVYVLLQLTCSILYTFVVLPLLHKILTSGIKCTGFGDIRKIIVSMSEALTTAFATSSSLATLPLTMRAAEFRLFIHPRIVKLVFPSGSIINMNGYGFYIPLCAIFLANSESVDIYDPSFNITLFILTLLASVAAAGVPNGHMVIILSILTNLRVPINNYPLIIISDLIVDRLITVTNVMGDIITAAIVNDRSKQELEDAESRSRNYSRSESRNYSRSASRN